MFNRLRRFTIIRSQPWSLLLKALRQKRLPWESQNNTLLRLPKKPLKTYISIDWNLCQTTRNLKRRFSPDEYGLPGQLPLPDMSVQEWKQKLIDSGLADELSRDVTALVCILIPLLISQSNEAYDSTKDELVITRICSELSIEFEVYRLSLRIGRLAPCNQF